MAVSVANATFRTEGAHSPAHASRAVDELKSLIKGSHKELLHEIQQSNKKHEDRKQCPLAIGYCLPSLSFSTGRSRRELISPTSGLDAISIDE